MEIASLSANTNQILVLTDKGTVWEWVRRKRGPDSEKTKLNFPKTYKEVLELPKINMVAAGSLTGLGLALSEDGKVYAWSLQDDRQSKVNSKYGGAIKPTLVEELNEIKLIRQGGSHILALDEAGRVYSWGDNISQQANPSQLKDIFKPQRIEELKGIVEIYAGAYHSIALDEKGQVFTWGDNSRGQLGGYVPTKCYEPIQVKKLPTVCSVKAGPKSSLALGNNGNVYYWGLWDSTLSLSFEDPRMIPEIWNIKKISIGETFIAAINKKEQVFLVETNKWMDNFHPISIGNNLTKELLFNQNNSWALKPLELEAFVRQGIGNEVEL